MNKGVKKAFGQMERNHAARLSAIAPVTMHSTGEGIARCPFEVFVFLTSAAGSNLRNVTTVSSRQACMSSRRYNSWGNNLIMSCCCRRRRRCSQPDWLRLMPAEQTLESSHVRFKHGFHSEK